MFLFGQCWKQDIFIVIFTTPWTEILCSMISNAVAKTVNRILVGDVEDAAMLLLNKQRQSKTMNEREWEWTSYLRTLI